MLRPLALLAVLAALAAYAAQASASNPWDSWSSGPDLSPPLLPPPDPDEAVEAAVDIMAAPSLDARVNAFLAAIRRFESGGQYSVMYPGNRYFSDYSKHPRSPVPILIKGYEGKKSSAAGAYQITAPTYDEFAPALGITDFSPASQDAIALAIVKRTGAYDALIAGDIESAFRLASSRWASLPGSTAGQNPKSADTVLAWFEDYLSNNA